MNSTRISISFHYFLYISILMHPYLYSVVDVSISISSESFLSTMAQVTHTDSLAFPAPRNKPGLYMYKILTAQCMIITVQ